MVLFSIFPWVLHLTIHFFVFQISSEKHKLDNGPNTKGQINPDTQNVFVSRNNKSNMHDFGNAKQNNEIEADIEPLHNYSAQNMQDNSFAFQRKPQQSNDYILPEVEVDTSGIKSYQDRNMNKKRKKHKSRKSYSQDEPTDPFAQSILTHNTSANALIPPDYNEEPVLNSIDYNEDQGFQINNDQPDINQILPPIQPNYNYNKYEQAYDSGDVSQSDVSVSLSQFLDDFSISTSDASRQINAMAEDIESINESVAEQMMNELVEKIDRKETQIDFKDDFLGIPKAGPLANDSDDVREDKHYEMTLFPKSRFLEDTGPKNFKTKHVHKNTQEIRTDKDFFEDQDAAIFPQYNILQRGVYDDDPMDESEYEEDFEPKYVISRYLQDTDQELKKRRAERRKEHHKRFVSRKRFNPLILPNFEVIRRKKTSK